MLRLGVLVVCCLAVFGCSKIFVRSVGSEASVLEGLARQCILVVYPSVEYVSCGDFSDGYSACSASLQEGTDFDLLVFKDGSCSIFAGVSYD